MTNEGMPTVGPGASGDPVSQAQRVLRRTPNTALVVDGTFGPKTEAATRDFQWASHPVDGVVGQRTWTALPLALEFAVGLQHAAGD
jgi:peptidoglycan hydrolase-like protein with peptidoglycan-binding domain